MMSDSTSNAFLKLLGAGLWNSKPDSSTFASLSDMQWNHILSLAQKHSVTGVCYAAIENLPADMQPNEQTLLQWYGQSQYIRAVNRRMADVWGELDSILRREGVVPVLIKGLAVASCYPDAELRMAGDIDIFLGNQLHKSVEVLQKKGFDVRYDPIHHKLRYRGVDIELHGNIYYMPNMPLNVSDRTFLKYTEAWTQFEPTLDAQILLTHSALHLAGPGVGFRHLCDWCRFIYCNKTVIDFKRLSDDIRALGLERFASAFSALAVKCLGADFSEMNLLARNADSKIVDALFEDMMSSGDCGKETIARRGKNYRIGHYLSKVRRLMKFYSIAPKYTRQISVSKFRAVYVKR